MNNGMGRFLLFAPFVLGLSILIGAVLLRAAVALVNLFIVSRRHVPQSVPFLDPGVSDTVNSTSGPANDPNPFAAPLTGTIAIDASAGDGIPEPAFGRACLIVFVNAIVLFGIQFISSSLVLVAGGDGAIVQLLLLAFQPVISVIIHQSMLKTTLGRAALVWLVQLLIVFGIAVVVFGTIAGIRAST